MSFFKFLDLNYAQKTWRKALGGIVLVDKNKPKSNRFFGAIYLKIVRTISSNSI